ncbi:hypothetical protein AB0K05_44305 [Nonomuraea sp. NPDC049486]|uniref:hypothetical protein n=1 Tax=Nonomuraea sp. NPDC049486 TaxID=3155773 RepID=UPI0034211FB5
MAIATAAIMNPTPAMAKICITSRIGCAGDPPSIAPHDLKTASRRKEVPNTKKVRRPVIMKADGTAKEGADLGLLVGGAQERFELLASCLEIGPMDFPF